MITNVRVVYAAGSKRFVIEGDFEKNHYSVNLKKDKTLLTPSTRMYKTPLRAADLRSRSGVSPHSKFGKHLIAEMISVADAEGMFSQALAPHTEREERRKKEVAEWKSYRRVRSASRELLAALIDMVALFDGEITGTDQREAIISEARAAIVLATERPESEIEARS